MSCRSTIFHIYFQVRQHRQKYVHLSLVHLRLISIFGLCYKENHGETGLSPFLHNTAAGV